MSLKQQNEKRYGRNSEVSNFLLYWKGRKILPGVSAPAGTLLNSALVCHPINIGGKYRANVMCHQRPFISPERCVETWMWHLEVTVQESRLQLVGSFQWRLK